jgi:hypothetical protein
MMLISCVGLVFGKISGGGDGEEFSRYTSFAVGDGSKIRCWHDMW